MNISRRFAVGQGFTLVELMITVAIVAILASVALPSYQSHIKKTRRADAQGALMGFGNAMERFFTEKNTYLGAAGSSSTPANTGAPWIFKSEAPLDGSTKYYDLTISNATATSYELRAVPKGSQNGDGFLQLKSSGERAWDKNNDNAIVDAEKSW